MVGTANTAQGQGATGFGSVTGPAIVGFGSTGQAQSAEAGGGVVDAQSPAPSPEPMPSGLNNRSGAYAGAAPANRPIAPMRMVQLMEEDEAILAAIVMTLARP